MKAELLLRQRRLVEVDAFAELVVWRVPAPKPGSHHTYKYRFAYIVKGACVLRYDNESGKGDHVHHGTTQRPYMFSTPDKLLSDFWRDVSTWRR